MSLEDVQQSIDKIHIEDGYDKESDDTNTELDTVDVTHDPSSILKPRQKRGRPPLTDAQKRGLAIGRQNHKLRMAKKTIADIEQAQQETQQETPKPKPKPKPKSKQRIIYQSDSSESEDDVIIVKKKPKKKKKTKVVYESDSSSSDDEPEPPPPPQMTRQDSFVHPQYEYRGGIFR